MSLRKVKLLQNLGVNIDCLIQESLQETRFENSLISFSSNINYPFNKEGQKSAIENRIIRVDDLLYSQNRQALMQICHFYHLNDENGPEVQNNIESLKFKIFRYFGINKLQIENTLKLNVLYARGKNQITDYKTMPLTPVPNLRGEFFGKTPKTLRELNESKLDTERVLEALLDFYGMPYEKEDSLNKKIWKVKIALGLRQIDEAFG
ncbi:hypothetical protein DASC09_009150 [Saccharomycopsis crataegensis]|uniref:Uncharacterized protein n=1 Tax=Saccharomycopsis crataegensis TaxID=43959 RepID=A0AAV5QGR8_9ASCO|nr:hypothetical protein DASC09_009150 [Saccharomycopsis crataegensis]